MKDLEFCEVSMHSLRTTYYKLNRNTKVNQKDSFDFTATSYYILNSKWP